MDNEEQRSRKHYRENLRLGNTSTNNNGTNSGTPVI